jgi:hypothetical protein
MCITFLIGLRRVLHKTADRGYPRDGVADIRMRTDRPADPKDTSGRPPSPGRQPDLVASGQSSGPLFLNMHDRDVKDNLLASQRMIQIQRHYLLRDRMNAVGNDATPWTGQFAFIADF